MRHRVFGRKLARDTNSRQALLSNLSSSLLEKGKITTTFAKAKFVQPFVEKMITVAKRNRLNRERMLASLLTARAFLRLTAEISPGFKTRVGGYTRIIKLGARRGDNTQMVRIEFLEWDKSLSKLSKGDDKRFSPKSKLFVRKSKKLSPSKNEKN